MQFSKLCVPERTLKHERSYTADVFIYVVFADTKGSLQVSMWRCAAVPAAAFLSAHITEVIPAIVLLALFPLAACNMSGAEFKATGHSSSMLNPEENNALCVVGSLSVRKTCACFYSRPGIQVVLHQSKCSRAIIVRFGSFDSLTCLPFD